MKIIMTLIWPGSLFQRAFSALEQQFQSPKCWNDDDGAGIDDDDYGDASGIDDDDDDDVLMMMLVIRFFISFTRTNPHSKTPETEKAIRKRKKMNWKKIHIEVNWKENQSFCKICGNA